MMTLQMKEYNMIFKEKRKKYQHYDQVKLKDLNILLVKKYDIPINVK